MKIEGKNAVKEFLKGKGSVEKIVIQNGLGSEFVQEIKILAQQKNAKIVFVDKRQLEKESETNNAQGIIAYVSDYEYYDFDKMLNEKLNEDKFFLILDGIEDPHNLGSIIRVAECAGIDGIIIPKHRAVAVNETAIKTSAGAIAHVKIAKVTNINDAIETMKKRNIFVYAADMNGDDMTTTNLRGNIAIVIGAEGKGVSKLTKEKCDAVVSIPMLGRINSLNASVSCGILVFEANRQRKGKK